MSSSTGGPFQKWYGANKEKYNAERKSRYHKDPAYREAVIERQRKSRKDNPRPSQAAEKHYREIGDATVEVFRIGFVVETIGRSEKTIRTWETKGTIPKPSIPGKHRYYTLGQVKLLKEFSELMEQVRYDKALREFSIEKKSAEMHQNWEV